MFEWYAYDACWNKEGLYRYKEKRKMKYTRWQADENCLIKAHGQEREWFQQSIESFPRDNNKTQLKLLLLRISNAGNVVEFEYSIIPIERSIGNVH